MQALQWTLSRLGVTLVLPFVIASCGGDDTGNPVGPSNPSPAPSSLTLSGTVSESAPTTNVRIAGAVVAILDGTDAGRTATTDANGSYRIEGLRVGGFNVSVNAGGYEESRAGINLAGSVTHNVQLRPAFRTLDETLSGTVSAGEPVCAGSSISGRPCRRFELAVHHGGTLTARLEWSTRTNDLDLELWRGSTMLASSRGVGDQESVSSAVSAGAMYELRVVYYEGATVQPFTLRVQRPN
jgi:hypothetical protein